MSRAMGENVFEELWRDTRDVERRTVLVVVPFEGGLLLLPLGDLYPTSELFML